MATDLKPCPFCGAEPILIEHPAHSHSTILKDIGMPDHPGSWTVECCDVGMIKDTRAEVVAAWNRRAVPAQASAPAVDDLAMLVARLVRALRKAAPDNELSEQALDYLKREGLTGSALRAAPVPAQGEPAKFQLGDLVRKTKGSQWTGRVVGKYATSLTPEGYCVESSTEHGSVQIYPAAALELVQSGQPEQSKESA